MSEKQSGGKALAGAALAYLEAHSAEKFSLEEMSKSLFVNGSHLLRTFRRLTGMTLLECHHKIRCEKAKKLLAESDLTISEIGEAVGFVSSSHFSHIFRKCEGCTPREFRSLHRAASPEKPEDRQLCS